MRFQGKGVIVTGAGQGIGRATAQRFASEGAEVMLVGRTEALLQETAALVVAEGGSAWAHVCDVRDSAGVTAAVAAACARWDGCIDVLVNNAGIDDETPFLEMTEEAWRAVVETNLTGPFLFSRAVAPEMVRAGGGVILHNASIDASGGDGPFASYNASKAGLLGLNRTMALELGPHGVRVNCVSPGFTHTDMTERAVGPAMMGYLNGQFARVPLRRLVKPSEIAAAFAFLASDDASGITGIDLTVDCGLTANWFILETLPEL
ncbi:MAG: meso-butanediol dehydrogenase / (S,S)-butanediol dehydrogenase / diacetyl reductase [Gaiellales bacterium]|nr:meso-butanediol dehydrogenase / (S,S)-butanediol dehydrogenase / diacetyl reductase [Gaiellales bacterium]